MTALPASMCHRLRGLSILAGDGCACWTAGGFLECPPEARKVIPRGVVAKLSGDFCADCGSPNMIRTGTCLTCTSCGSSSGGCS